MQGQQEMESDLSASHFECHYSSTLRLLAWFWSTSGVLLSFFLNFFLMPTSFCCVSFVVPFLAVLPGNTCPSTVTSAHRCWATRKSLTSQAKLPSRSMKITLFEPTTNLQEQT
ncbi:hypothetical protein XENORESO_004912 [Xenotaenia resolanae]|uniref:Uncharacterized protein n=1 Tax=Xenotaenia resolanae TaxID=208358 RepID=A0ABV0W770_9TELE